ncbi:STAS domain-containing protein [Alkalimarinus coralli]|uniref:STAS domain-containing protein n=1 Tax=Alkalimarinus coralli TaxID=2935863 RepID=UPI00202B5D11|nr:STAS domain-containing protein [Alkalimarinus coralli]
MVAEVSVQDAGILALSGDVTSDNVVSIRRKGEDAIAKMPSSAIVNLAGLGAANTLTLSLLLAWVRCARQQNMELTIAESPGKLFDMARVSGLELVLPFEPSGS